MAESECRIICYKDGTTEVECSYNSDFNHDLKSMFRGMWDPKRERWRLHLDRTSSDREEILNLAREYFDYVQEVLA